MKFLFGQRALKVVVAAEGWVPFDCLPIYCPKPNL
jgi:hypothetical protein